MGGVEIHTKTLFEFFNKKKQDVYIATSFDENRKKSDNKIFQFKIKGNLARGYKGETLKYQDFLLNKKFDIIFFNAAQQWSFDLALPILENINAKKILFPCGFSRHKNFLYRPYFEIIKNKINNFDKIICSNKKSLDYLYLKKFYKKKIFIVNNGANKIKNSKNNANLLKKYSINKNTNIFINISNIKYNKGQDRVIKIFNKIPLKNIMLIFVGNNHSFLYFNFIKIRIAVFNYFNKYKKILLLEDNKNLVKYLYQRSNFFIFGSRLEYDPLVMYESIISNTKFISYEVGTCPQILNKKNYGIASNDDAKKVQFIMKQVKHKFDNKNIAEFNWGNICKKYYRIFFN